MQNAGIQRCQTCGANLSVHDLTRDDCPYCRTALPHRARAQQQAALVQEILKGQGVHPGVYPGPNMVFGGGHPMQVGDGVVVAQRVVMNIGAPQTPQMAAQMQANAFAHVNQIQNTVHSAVRLWLFAALGFTVLILALVFGLVAWSMT